MNEDIQTEYSDSYVIHEPRVVAAGRGAAWLAEGFACFRNAPGQWLALCIVGFVIMIGIGMVPLLGLVSGILAPVWSAGLMLGCKDMYEGKPLQIRHLFAGFGDKVGILILSGLLLSGISLAILLLIFGPLFFQLVTGNEEAIVNQDWLAFAIRGLLAMVLMIPIYAAALYSPALIVLGNQGIMDSLKLSLSACFVNILPFLVYGLLGFLLTIPVALTFGLALLIVGPMFIFSIFISFREIFVED